MQWRLIRLGQLARCDVWVPRNDQPKQYEGHQFRDFVLHEFHETLDVPRSIKNIDVVWKFGPYSIKSAFEIEHSTSDLFWNSQTVRPQSGGAEFKLSAVYSRL